MLGGWVLREGKHLGSDGRGSVGMPQSWLGDRRGWEKAGHPGKGSLVTRREGGREGGKFEGGSGLWVRGEVLGAGPSGRDG